MKDFHTGQETLLNDIYRGDIVMVIRDEYIAFPGGKWIDHFAPCKHFYIAMDNSRNNGYFYGIDKNDTHSLINVKDVIKVKRNPKEDFKFKKYKKGGLHYDKVKL